MTKVSIIIPTFNAEEYLDSCLESVISQSLEDIEIICVDDGSSDSTLKILNKYSEKDSRINIISSKHQGIGNSRNKGIKISKGEYILFVDADDWIEKKCCENLYEACIQNNYDLIFFKMLKYDDYHHDYQTGYKIMFTYMKQEKSYFNYKNIMDKLFKSSFSPCNKLYKREFLLKNKIYFIDEDLIFEDHPFFFKTVLKAEKMGFANKYLYYKRHYGTELPNYKNNLSDILPITDSVIEIFKEEGVYDSMKRKLMNYKVNIVKTCFGSLNKMQKEEFFEKMSENFQIIGSDPLLNQEYMNMLDHQNKLFYQNIFKSSLCSEFLALNRINTLEKENQTLKNKAKKIHASNKKLKKNYKKISRSTSWKITKPLRGIKKMFN